MELYQNLQWFNQGFKIVEDYYKEMEVAITRANLEEDKEAIMAWLLNGLHQDIVNKVRLHRHIEFEDIVHMEITVERQLKKRGNRTLPQRSNPTTQRTNPTRPWKPTWRKEEGTSSNPRSKPFKAKDVEISKDKGKTITQIYNHGIMYFHCLRRGM